MQPSFDNDAKRPTAQAPLSAGLVASFDSPEAAQSAIAAIWKREADRLLRHAYRMVHRIEGADPEGIVSDAVLWTMENWQGITDAEHCRKRLLARVHNICRDTIKCRKFYDVVEKVNLPDTSSHTTKAIDSSVAWLFTHCADAEERYILELYLQPGNGTYESVSEATRSRSGKWLTGSWTPRQVFDLFKRLRNRAEVTLTSEARRLLRQPMTKGTMPGQHWERHTPVWSLALCTLPGGSRPLTRSEILCQRVVVPAYRLSGQGTERPVRTKRPYTPVINGRQIVPVSIITGPARGHGSIPQVPLTVWQPTREVVMSTI